MPHTATRRPSRSLLDGIMLAGMVASDAPESGHALSGSAVVRGDGTDRVVDA